MNSSSQVSPHVVAELHDLELRLTAPDIRKSPDELSRLLADEFREFGGSGREFTKEAIIAALQTQPSFEVQIQEFRASSLGPEAVLVTYQAACQVAGSETVLRSLRSSIWQKRDGRWMVTFHQGTPMPGSPNRIGAT